MGIQVGIDLMGGDLPPHAIFEAVLKVAKERKASDRLVVFASHASFSDLKLRFNQELTSSLPIEFITTDEVVEMDDSPLLAVRRKRRSTMAIGMQCLQERKLQAFVSLGNTGALVATALLHLPLLPHVERPALLVLFPTGSVALDVGANIYNKPQQLLSYAILGSAFQECINQISRPKIGLLNIGVEEEKGTEGLKETYRLLQNKFQESFIGNIEGREVFQGSVDVLVTDGFTGNIFLKTSEGVCRFLIDYLYQNFDAKEIVSHLNKKFNYAENSGAVLCGVDGLVIKCHGHSDVYALTNGIRGAFQFSELGLIEKLKAQLHSGYSSS